MCLNIRTTLIASTLLSAVLITGAAQAALVDRGGLIYDTDLNVTWLKDANYAQTSGDVAAVPEAETYALMLAGLGLIGWRARRRG